MTGVCERETGCVLERGRVRGVTSTEIVREERWGGGKMEGRVKERGRESHYLLDGEQKKILREQQKVLPDRRGNTTWN
jgi:hypothetical protein